MKRASWVVVAISLLLASCGAGEDAATTTTAVSTTLPTATTTNAPTTSTTALFVTTTVAPSTTSAQEIDVHFDAGQVIGPESFSFVVGDEVSIWLLSDIDEEVHVHGYDVSFPVKAAVPLEIVLTADVPGIFEVEMESSHTLLFELLVNP